MTCEATVINDHMHVCNTIVTTRDPPDYNESSFELEVMEDLRQNMRQRGNAIMNSKDCTDMSTCKTSCTSGASNQNEDANVNVNVNQKRKDFLEKRKESSIYDKLWKAHEEGLAVTSNASLKSTTSKLLNRRNRSTNNLLHLAGYAHASSSSTLHSLDMDININIDMNASIDLDHNNNHHHHHHREIRTNPSDSDSCKENKIFDKSFCLLPPVQRKSSGCLTDFLARKSRSKSSSHSNLQHTLENARNKIPILTKKISAVVNNDNCTEIELVMQNESTKDKVNGNSHLHLHKPPRYMRRHSSSSTGIGMDLDLDSCINALITEDRNNTFFIEDRIEPLSKTKLQTQTQTKSKMKKMQSFDDFDLIHLARNKNNADDYFGCLNETRKRTSSEGSQDPITVINSKQEQDAENHDTWSMFWDQYQYPTKNYMLLYYNANANAFPFLIFGTSADDAKSKPHVLSPPLMESLQEFLPYAISEDNFWMKYSMVRDGASLDVLLDKVRGASSTILAIETIRGEVFGSFQNIPWKINQGYYGNGESFLWKMRQSRSTAVCDSIIDQAAFESRVDVYPWSGTDDMIQYCSRDIIAVGGGGSYFDVDVDVDFDDEDNHNDNHHDCMDNHNDNHHERKGDGHEFFGLVIDSNLSQGISSPCVTFGSPSLTSHSLDGSFEIANLEVWSLTSCMTETEAEKLELSGLFLRNQLQ